MSWITEHDVDAIVFLQVSGCKDWWGMAPSLESVSQSRILLLEIVHQWLKLLIRIAKKNLLYESAHEAIRFRYLDMEWCLILLNKIAYNKQIQVIINSTFDSWFHPYYVKFRKNRFACRRRIKIFTCWNIITLKVLCLDVFIFSSWILWLNRH